MYDLMTFQKIFRFENLLAERALDRLWLLFFKLLFFVAQQVILQSSGLLEASWAPVAGKPLLFVVNAHVLLQINPSFEALVTDLTYKTSWLL